eukprot:Nitzschia sp. Nitz4//scaffold14_size191712//125738//128560//NITZ4_001737-RA/size191712-snap-gene-0.139-mRNA-1//1//CDS//3329536969//5363//frame0
MGTCLSAFAVSECRHEILNEYNDRYFDRVEARNSADSSPKRWFRSKSRRETLPKLHEDYPTETWEAPAVLTDVSTPVSSAEEKKEGFLNESPVRNLDDELSDAFRTPKRRERRKHGHPRSVDGSVDSWKVKRKGRALQMRLATNRMLQLAATASEVTLQANCQPLSPITISTASMGSFGPTPQVSPSTAHTIDWNPEFENTGMVWVEFEQNEIVTAVAMSRNPESRLKVGPSNRLRPLLMAIGDQAGKVSITEIIDEQRHPLSQGLEQGPAQDSSLFQQFGETLEVSTPGRIRDMAFSPNGDYLVVGGDECVASVFLIVVDPTNQKLRDLRLLKQVERVDRIYSVQFHPMNGLLALAGFDGKVAVGPIGEILSSTFNKCDEEFHEIDRMGLVYSCHWSPCGRFFAVGGSDKKVAIYDSNMTLLREVIRPASIQTLRWNNDGSMLAIGDREVAILNTQDFQVKCEICNSPDSPSSTSSSRYKIESLCWSPDGGFLAIGGSDCICLIIETKGYALVHEVHRTGSILGLGWGERVLNGENGRYLAILDGSRNVALVKAGSEVEGSDVDENSSSATSSYFSSNSDWVLREDSFKDVEENSSSQLTKESKPHRNISVASFSNSTDGKGSAYLAYAADDSSLSLVATQDWKSVFQMTFVKPLRALAFSHSGKFLAVGGDEGSLYVFSVATRSVVFNIMFSSAITTIAFSLEDERLSVGSKDGALSLHCPDADWEPVGELDFSESPILCQSWCSKCLAVGRADGSVAVFDTDKAFSNFFVPLAEFSHSVPIRSLSFGANGRFLTVGGDSGVVSVLSSKGGWVMCNQFKVDCSVLATAWSPAGRYLAFGGPNTLQVIDTITWTEVTEIKKATDALFEQESTSAVASIEWSLDGKWVVLGTTGGGIRIVGTSGWRLLPQLPGLESPATS